MAQKRYWFGKVPARCQLSGMPITNEFIDGATVYGPWGIMHPDALSTYGVGLGTGRGQRYMKTEEEWDDGSVKWLKVEG